MNQLKATDDAIYLPAISEAYARHDVSQPLPRALRIHSSDLDYLDPANRLFHYPYGLYSAGQAAKSDNSVKKNHLLTARDRSSSIVLADSGGFQIQQGTIPFKGTATTLRMLRWMEKNGDYSMVLDFPTGGISRGNMTKHRKRLEAEGHDIEAMNAANQLGLDYNACLKQSCINNDFMRDNRVPGATKLLNVIQGRNESESRHWYEAVRHYPFEGWSIAGGHQSSFSMTLNRVFDIADDGLWPNAEWLHVLGTSKLWAGALLSVLQRGIRSRFDNAVQVSYDSSSPFYSASKANLTTGYILDRFGWGFTQENVHNASTAERAMTLNEWARTRPIPRDATGAVQSEYLYIKRSWTPARTGIGDEILVGDLFEPVNSQYLGEIGVKLLMNHNTQVFVKAFKVANELFTTDDLDLIPNEYLQIKYLLEAAFCHSSPRQFLSEAKPRLDTLAHL